MLKNHKQHIIQRFTVDLYSANMIAKELGVTRQAVLECLRAWGYGTSKASSGSLEVTCSLPSCGRAYRIPRSVARRKKEENEPNFCSKKCSGAFRKLMRIQKKEK